MKYQTQYGNWTEGKVDGYDFCIKHFEEGSSYGIDGGCISKLEIRKDGKILANYDRGWDIEVPEEAQTAYLKILAQFNFFAPAPRPAPQPRMSPYERTRAAVYATGNKWAIENFNATH